MSLFAPFLHGLSRLKCILWVCLRYIWTLKWNTFTRAKIYNKVWRATFRRETHLSGGVTSNFIPAILTCYKLVLNTFTYTHKIKFTIYIYMKMHSSRYKNVYTVEKCFYMCTMKIYLYLLYTCIIYMYISAHVQKIYENMYRR